MNSWNLYQEQLVSWRTCQRGLVWNWMNRPRKTLPEKHHISDPLICIILGKLFYFFFFFNWINIFKVVISMFIRLHFWTGLFPCRMLDDFSHEMDNTHSKLDNVMKKLAKVSHMTSGNLPSNSVLVLWNERCTVLLQLMISGWWWWWGLD